MDLLDKLRLIRDYYEKHDAEVRAREGKLFFRTSHGLWGAAGMLDMFEFFMKADTGRFTFADYGSGDGRIVLIAALFGKATGIEGEEKLVALSNNAKRELRKKIPELERAEFKVGDYYEEQHKDYDLLFFFPDHPFPEEFQKKLLKNFEGYLLVYNKIHSPELLKKGKTYWVQQLPIISYPVNRPEEDLFSFSENQQEKHEDNPSEDER